MKTVQILIDENFKNYAVTELSRPHVKNACNSYINADKSGFEYAIEVSELANGNHTVTAITTGNDGSYAQQTMGFNVNVSNSGSKVTALTLIGSFLGGIKDAAADNLQGMFQIITHPIKSAEAVGFLLYAANNKDSEEYKMLMEMVKNELDEIANKFTNGDGNVKARMIGRAVGELFIAVVGPKGIKQGLELLSKVSKGTKLGSLVQKGMTAAEALNITERAAEALSAVKDALRNGGERVFERVKSVFRSGADELKLVDKVSGQEFTLCRSQLKAELMAQGMSDEAAESALKFLEDGCFAGDTLVTTREGLKRIDEIQVGDYVLAKDIDTGNTCYKQVKQVYIKSTDTFIRLNVEGEEIRTTSSHVFFTNTGWWKAAGNIKEGDKIVDSSGEMKEVKSIELEKLDEYERIYNFNVEDYHTYFVGSHGLLVHNDCSPVKAELIAKRVLENKYFSK